jgi:hypothetical protein
VKRDRHRGRGVVDAAADLGDQVTDDEPDRDPAGGGADELQARFAEGEAAADRGGDRDLVDDEGAGVVDQALALEDVDGAPRHPESAQDRARGDRVGRRDDRPQREGRGPGQVEDRVGQPADYGGGRQDQADRHQRDHPQVFAQRRQVGEEGVGVQQRRQEQEQDEVRVEVDLGDARDHPEDEPAEDEDDRVGHRAPVGDRVQQRDRDQQRRDEDLDLAHGRILPARL